MTHDKTVDELAHLLVKLWAADWAVETDPDAEQIQRTGDELADLIQEFLDTNFPI